MKLLKSDEVAKKLGYAITQFKTVIKHQPNFPKPLKAHPKAHPKWRDCDIDNYLMRGAV
jgi:predicted DNA-binding transcriptional regulator AlpA